MAIETALKTRRGDVQAGDFLFHTVTKDFIYAERKLSGSRRLLFVSNKSPQDNFQVEIPSSLRTQPRILYSDSATQESGPNVIAEKEKTIQVILPPNSIIILEINR